MSRRPLFPEAPNLTNLQGWKPFPYSDLGAEVSGWSPKFEVGAGSFGAVVHRIKTDKDGNKLDELALKSISWSADDDFPNAPVKGFNKEAGLQAQLNEFGCENIVHLRGFKFDVDSTCSKLYLEYAPNGNLERLRHNYRTSQKYFSEAFFWFAFHSFAKAICVMSTEGKGVWKNLGTGGAYKPNSSVLHFDIKSSNIVVGHWSH
jgi:serine/threonine protein kinase